MFYNPLPLVFGLSQHCCPVSLQLGPRICKGHYLKSLNRNGMAEAAKQTVQKVTQARKYVLITFQAFSNDHCKPQIPVYDTSDRLSLILVYALKMQETGSLSHTFLFILPKKNTSFGFCSCSEFLRLKF